MGEFDLIARYFKRNSAPALHPSAQAATEFVAHTPSPTIALGIGDDGALLSPQPGQQYAPQGQPMPGQPYPGQYQPQPGQPYAAHTLLLFEFPGDRMVGLTVEARLEKTETYSAVDGMFNRYELAYMWNTAKELLTRLTAEYEQISYDYFQEVTAKTA